MPRHHREHSIQNHREPWTESWLGTLIGAGSIAGLAFGWFTFGAALVSILAPTP